MVPIELVVSPQLIVALKSLRVPVDEPSVNSAVDPTKVVVMTGGIVQLEVSAASATVAVELVVAVLPELSTSVIVTLIVYLPSSL